MRKRIAVVAVSACALTGLFAAPASAAGGCVSLHVTINGQDLVDQAFCSPS